MNSEPTNGQKGTMSSLPDLISLSIRQGLPTDPGHSDGGDGQFGKAPADFAALVWEMGWTDGRLGQPSDKNVTVLKQQAGVVASKQLQADQGELAKIEETVRHLEDSERSFATRLREAGDAEARLSLRSVLYPGEFSRLSGVINLVIAVVALLADLPLSLSLVATGFDIRIQGDRLSVRDLFSQPGEVLRLFWEPVLLCIGIALLGLFFKILAEDLIDRSAENERGRSWFRRFVWTIGTLLVIAIIALGFLRAQVNESVRRQQRELARQEAQATNGSPQDLPPPNDDTKLPAELPAFILLTVLFPIVGGITFAVGWKKFQNRSMLIGLRNETASLQLKLNDLRGEIVQARANRESVLRRVTGNGAWAATLEGLWISVYRHGYDRGRQVPETLQATASIYDRCEHAFHKFVARQAQQL